MQCTFRVISGKTLSAGQNFTLKGTDLGGPEAVFDIQGAVYMYCQGEPKP